VSLIPEDIEVAWLDASEALCRTLGTDSIGELLTAARAYVRADNAFVARLEELTHEMLARQEGKRHLTVVG